MEPSDRKKGALGAIRVIDLTRVLAGPFCTMLLGDMGAQIIKIETPGVGDDARRYPPFIGDDSAYFMNLNRNKKSITLNLKTDEGKRVFFDLVAKSDVIIENFRPGTMERLGLGYDQVTMRNPDIIFASISGFGQTGPLPGPARLRHHRPGHGRHHGRHRLAGQPPDPHRHRHRRRARRAEHLRGDPRRVARPSKRPCGTADRRGAGRFGGVGHGDHHPDLPGRKTRAAAGGQPLRIYLSLRLLRGPKRLGRHRPSATTSCGTASAKPSAPKRCSQKRSTADNADRVRHHEEIYRIVEDWTRPRTVDQVVEFLLARNIPCAPIYTIKDIVSDRHIAGARKMFQEIEHPSAGRHTVVSSPIKMSATPPRIDTPAPQLGQHTDEILTGILGYPKEKAEALKRDRIT